MSSPLARVDFSDALRCVQRVVVRPGLPLLDTALANARTLHAWLGRLVAEVKWDGEAIQFFVRDDDGAMPEIRKCRPATSAELTGVLRPDIEALREKLRETRPQSSAEIALHRVVSIQLEEAIGRAAMENPSSAFFWYRDQRGRTRLTWCWGYEPVATETTQAAVCPNPSCRLLTLTSAPPRDKCQRCGTELRRRRLVPAWITAVAVLLLLVGAAALGVKWSGDGRLHQQPTPPVAEAGGDAAPPETPMADPDNTKTTPTGQQATPDAEQPKEEGPAAEDAMVAEQPKPEGPTAEDAMVAEQPKPEGPAAAAAIVAGQVLDAKSKTPIAAAQVSLAGLDHRGETDADGRFRLEAVPWGTLEIHVAAGGYAAQQITRELQTADDLTVEVLLQGTAVLVGQVLDAVARSPVVGAEVTVAGQSQNATTDADGRFRIESLPGKSIAVAVSAAGYAKQEQTQALKSADETAVEVLLKGAAVLTGKVVDAVSQSPISGAKVTLVDRTGSAATGTDGRFRIESLRGGPAEIEVAAAGYVSQRIPQVLKDLEESTSDVRLHGSASLAGQVVDADSQAAIPGAALRLGESGPIVKVDGEGRFRIDGLRPGQQDLQVAAKGYSRERRTAALADAKETTLRVELKPISKPGPDKPPMIAPVPATVGTEPTVSFFGIQTKAGSVAFVVDSSGSMSGTRMARTKAELATSVIGLQPEQLFYVSFFNGGPIPMPGTKPVHASPLEKVRFLKWMKTIAADDGTEPQGALTLVAAMKPSAIFLLSDGGFSPLSPDTFQLLSAHRIKANTVAFEDDSGKVVLEEIAHKTGGTYKFVPASEQPPPDEAAIETALAFALIKALNEPPPSDAQEVRKGLVELCDRQDFGPQPGASPAELTQAAQDWTDWWIQHGLIRAFSGLPQETLVKEFHGPDNRYRRAAFLAAGQQRLRPVEEYIAALRDADAAVQQAARAALVAIADGQDYGPPKGAAPTARDKSIEDWSQWWKVRQAVEALSTAPEAMVLSRFRDPHPAVRKAALTEARKRRLPTWEGLIQALQDPVLDCREVARQALTGLTGGKVDFGPPVNAADTDWAATAKKWKDWRSAELQRKAQAEIDARARAEQARLEAEKKAAMAKQQAREKEAKEKLLAAQDLQRQYKRSTSMSYTNRIEILQKRFQEIIDAYPGTEAAKKAQEALKSVL
ncbi:MAG: carboxypeptidase regulatory-like domain-containing protein [Planctomycetota bacterium]|nr:carboxypeptidase regulatory-like domain-containing protein [Planctomycetota bacterium]